MRLLTLNLRHGGGRRMPALLSFLLAGGADVLVLTEFRNNAAGTALRHGLLAAGYTHQMASHDAPRVNAILIAAREPFRVRPEPALRFDPMRLLNVEFSRCGLLGLHLPNLKAKIPHWKALLKLAGNAPGTHRIYLGDFNTGRVPEDVEGADFRFTATAHMEALLHKGWSDAWRRLHPHGREFSWYSHRGRGFRLDHAFLSPACGPRLRAAEFDHGVRERGLTDHSALLVELDS